eukprot:5056395-Prymnesium_polylepis.2
MRKPSRTVVSARRDQAGRRHNVGQISALIEDLLAVGIGFPSNDRTVLTVHFASAVWEPVAWRRRQLVNCTA